MCGYNEDNWRDYMDLYQDVPCIVCGAMHTGAFKLGPCLNGHTIQEELAASNERFEDYQQYELPEGS